MTTIRRVTANDLADVVGIYNEHVWHSVATFDTEPVGVNHFAPRVLARETGDEFLVADDDGTVVGYAFSGAFRPRPAYAGTRETSVYVAPSVVGRGVGKALMTELIDRLDAAGVHTQMAVIALPNEASEALHTALGFTHVGTLKEVGRKFDRWVDTAWWQRISPTS